MNYFLLIIILTFHSFFLYALAPFKETFNNSPKIVRQKLSSQSSAASSPNKIRRHDSSASASTTSAIDGDNDSDSLKAESETLFNPYPDSEVFFNASPNLPSLPVTAKPYLFKNVLIDTATDTDDTTCVSATPLCLSEKETTSLPASPKISQSRQTKSIENIHTVLKQNTHKKRPSSAHHYLSQKNSISDSSPELLRKQNDYYKRKRKISKPKELDTSLSSEQKLNKEINNEDNKNTTNKNHPLSESHINQQTTEQKKRKRRPSNNQLSNIELPINLEQEHKDIITSPDTPSITVTPSLANDLEHKAPIRNPYKNKQIERLNRRSSNSSDEDQSTAKYNKYQKLQLPFIRRGSKSSDEESCFTSSEKDSKLNYSSDTYFVHSDYYPSSDNGSEEDHTPIQQKKHWPLNINIPKYKKTPTQKTIKARFQFNEYPFKLECEIK